MGLNDYGYACFVGTLRAALLMPIEQPLDYLKTQIQSRSYMGPTGSFIRSSIKEYGIIKLYTGFIPNTIRASLKQAYRLPLMIAMPNLYRNFMKNENFIQISSGMSIAAIESYIICPLERLKVWLMTSPNASIRGFIAQVNHIGQLFSGSTALLARQTLSWVSFLGFTSVFKELVISEKGSVDYWDLMIIGVIVGILNTFIIMPADFIKTHQQKFKEIEGGLLRTLKEITLSHKGSEKFKLVFCGWKIRITHYMINSIFMVNLVDHLEKRLSTRYN